jgi:hypothetical protein
VEPQQQPQQPPPPQPPQPLLATHRTDTPLNRQFTNTVLLDDEPNEVA